MDEMFNKLTRDRQEGTELFIKVPEDLVSRFFGLLQAGFRVRAATGASVKDFLCGQLGLPPEYVDDRIQTLFLDSKPVDDITTARIANGSRLALSAAMPGLAGALFRKGGRYSWMRRGISYKAEAGASRESDGWATIKLFNLVLRELGGFFLAGGVWLEAGSLRDFLARLPEGLLDAIEWAALDGEPIAPVDLATHEWPEELVLTKISTG